MAFSLAFSVLKWREKPRHATAEDVALNEFFKLSLIISLMSLSLSVVLRHLSDSEMD
jgi:hypothetical protein